MRKRSTWLRVALAGAALLAPVLRVTAQIPNRPELGPPPIAPAEEIRQPRLATDPRFVAAGNWIDTSNRAQVQSLYNSFYIPALSVPMNWTGNVATGDPGTTSQGYRDAVASIVNWYRGMAGVPMVITLNPDHNSKDQQAALMFSANGTLSHSPPTTWMWYTAGGAEAAGKSNICLWSWGMPPGCIDSYMEDYGSGNTAVGHRRWILRPQSLTFGTGDTSPPSNSWANALWVIDGTPSTPRPATRDTFVAWPSPGYFPYNVVPDRWSFSYPNATFASTVVTVNRGGVNLPVTLLPAANGYGENTLVWTLASWDAARPSADSAVTVSVNNVGIGSGYQNFSYQVTVFDASSTYAFLPTSATAAAGGGAGSTQLQVSPSTTSWQVSSSAAWLHITSATSGTGTATINYSVDPNPGSTARSATLGTAGAEFTLTQSAGAANSVPVTVSVTPSNGSVAAGTMQSFLAVFSDGDGASTLATLQLRLNTSNTAASGCDLTLNRSNNQLTLSDDSGAAGTSALLGASQSLANSQCTVYAASSSAASSVNNLTLTLSVRLAPQFSGAKTVFARARDILGGDSGWQTMGALSVTAPTLTLGHSTLYFGATANGAVVTGPQEVAVTVKGSGLVNWSVTADRPWLVVSPSSGSGTGRFKVSIQSTTLTTPASLSGTITVTAAGASNSPQSVGILLTVKDPASTVAPYGYVDTPADDTANVVGTIGVTGWALDDIEVVRVEIWREPVPSETPYSNGLVFIGNAVFLADARPDVASAFPNAPLHYRGGWGLGLLTNMLPNSDGSAGRGNGTYRLHVIAYDREGKPTQLGTPRFTVNNATATKPFGTLDTPDNGGAASGTAYPIWGWALTPQPAVIPTDGSTIWVFIDGQPVGHPQYNLYRSDIAGLFPGYQNTNGAVGVFVFDTTSLADGLHSIAWSVTDSLGRIEGIGSRVFQVQNGTPAEGTGNSASLALSIPSPGAHR